MYRYNKLYKELTQGKAIVEKTGDFIRDWTPNNVQSLVVGVDGIWVQYHVKPTKNKPTTAWISIKEMDGGKVIIDGAVEESKHFRAGDYKGVLQALVHPRACSALEEIVFCTTDYPSDLLALDVDLSALLRKGTPYTPKNILGRFPRLRSVTTVSATCKKVVEQYKSQFPSGVDPLCDTLCDALSSSFKFEPVRVFDNPLWYTRKPLRGEYYEMDAEGATLSKSWLAVEKKLTERDAVKAEQLKQEKLAISRGEIQATPAEEAAKPMLLSESDLAKLYALNAQAVFLSNIVSKLTAMYNNLSLYDASEWGYVVKEKEFIKALKLEYHTMFTKKTEVSLVSFARILSSIDQVGKLDGLLFLQYVYDAVNLRQIGKSKDIPVTTLSDVQDSIASLEEFTQKFAQITYARVLKSIFYYYNMYGVMRISARILPHHVNKLPSLYITRRESRMMAPFPEDIGAIANVLNIPYLTNGADNIPKLAAVVTIATDILTSIK